MEKIYCMNCGKVIDTYNVENRNMDIELKGNVYHYNGREAVCPDCGEPVFVTDILKYNRDKAQQAYREANAIISKEDILSIPEKYHISKRNISKYLGWGDVTFSRYCSDYVPTKHNSDVLKDIVNHPEHLTEKIKQYLQSHPDDKNAQRDLRKMTISNLYDAIINMDWDDESNIWTASSNDIPGLILEADSFDELTERVKSAVPELLRMNKLPETVMIEYRSNKKEMVYA